MADNPLSPEDNGQQMPNNVRSIAERAENGEPDQQEFPKGIIDVGAARTLKNLIKGGLPVESTVSMMSAEVPLRGGLPDPDGQHRFVVTTELHKAEEIAKREDGLLASWKVRSHLRPVYVESVGAHQLVVGMDRAEFEAFEQRARELGESSGALAARLLTEFIEQSAAGSR